MAAKTPTGGRRDPDASSTIRDLKNKSQEGKAAERLLNNSTLKKVLRLMHDDTIKRIEQSGPTETELREKLYFYLKAVETFETDLKLYLTRGKNAESKLERIDHGG